jgi:hypothetical protein
VNQIGRTALAVGIIALLVVVAYANNDVVRTAVARGIDTNTSSSAEVTATGAYSFSPSEIPGPGSPNLAANSTLNISFINGDLSGQVHTFTIIGCEGRVIPRSASITDYINGSKCSKAPLLNLVSSSATPKTVVLNTPPTGWFEFVCTESGHFLLGMYGYIAFGMALPANLTVSSPDTGPGIAVFIIVGTIVSLTVIAIVLGFVVGRREGSRHEMPPERLGYPEPGSPPARPPAHPPGPPTG